jgi:hypothetical protein
MVTTASLLAFSETWERKSRSRTFDRYARERKAGSACFRFGLFPAMVSHRPAESTQPMASRYSNMANVKENCPQNFYFAVGHQPCSDFWLHQHQFEQQSTHHDGTSRWH